MDTIYLMMEYTTVANTKNSQGGSNYDTHYLIALKEPSDSLVALRQELILHPSISKYAMEGHTFEECLAIIALHLDIVLDGMYDPYDLCAMLVEALRKKRFFPGTPAHLLVRGLVDVELIEKEGTVELVERDRNVDTIIPPNAIITETTSQTGTPDTELCSRSLGETGSNNEHSLPETTGTGGTTETPTTSDSTHVTTATPSPGK